MKKLVYVVVAGSLLAGCGEEYRAKKAHEAAWNEIKAANTVEAYTAFVEENPDSTFRVDALDRLSRVQSAKYREQFAEYIGDCASSADPESFEVRFFSAETLIEEDKLISDFGWVRSKGQLWKWSDKGAAIRMPNGSMFMLAQEMKDSAGGLAYSLGSNATLLGGICLDNLQLVGPATLASEGLLFEANSLLIYPRP